MSTGMTILLFGAFVTLSLSALVLYIEMKQTPDEPEEKKTDAS